MFLLRGIAVSLAFYFVSYCLVSGLVSRGWHLAKRAGSLSPRGMACLLFGMRIAPAAISALVTLVFVVPSFWRLEPRAIDEDLGIIPLVLGSGCLFLYGIGVYRVARALMRTSRVISNWLQGARQLDVGTAPPTFQAQHSIPPLTLAGVCRPRVVVSETTVSVLSEDELHMALQHEIAHLESRDNLKKLAFQLFPVPWMAGLESAWVEAAEIAADDRAVGSVRNALDLAAALIKLSRLVPVESAPAISMGLLHAGAVSSRVARLLAWDENQRTRATKLTWYAAPPVLGGLVCTILLYGPLLTQVHRVTEWLVQ